MILSRKSLLALAGLALVLSSSGALADPNFAQVVPVPAAKAAPDETAPAVFRVDFETSRGPVLVDKS
jgi:hypothetical protein